MRLPEYSTRRVVLVSMVFLALLVFGLVSWWKLPRDLMPEIEPPFITVITAFPGASAQDVENMVTRVVENNLAIVSNLKKLRSTSSEGVSFVICEFEWDTDLGEASNDIRDRLEFAKRFLPEDAETPVIFKFNTSMFPVAVFGATARESYAQLNRILDKEVADRLKREEGVGSVQVFGGRVRQINVILDRVSLENAGLTPAAVAARIAAENHTEPAGSIRVATREYLLRVPGEFTSAAEMAGTVLKAQGASVVRLSDVARVEDSFEEETRTVKVDGSDGAIFIVQKRSGANTVEVVRRVRARIETLKASLPRDVQLVEVFNSAQFIERSLGDLSRTTMLSVVLVVAVTLLLLRRWRASAVVLTAIPASIIVAFGGLYLLGYTINVISLFSVAVGVGIVVDNAIVVVDNVARHIERGERPMQAAAAGAGEVAAAVIASTLTTVVVFVPLFFTRGITRIFFGQLAMVLIITIGCSLMVSLTLSPALCSRLFRRERRGGPPPRGVLALGERLLGRIEDAYERLLGAGLAHRWAVLLIAVALLASIAVPLGLKLVGTEFAPEQDTGDISVTAELAPGTRVEETARVGLAAERAAREVCGDDLLHIYLSAGQDRKGMGGRFGMRQGPHVFSVGAKLTSVNVRRRNIKDIAELLRTRLEAMPELVKVSVSTQNPMDAMLMGGGGKAIQVEIVGHDLEATDRLADQVRRIMEQTPGAREPTVSRDAGKPEIEIRVNRALASQKGVALRTLAETLRDNVYGGTAGQYRLGGDEYDIFLQLDERDRRDIEDVRQIRIPTVLGGFVPLAAVAEIRETTGPIAIDRQDQERIVRVECAPYGRDMGSVATEIERRIRRELVLPAEVSVSVGGQYKEFQDVVADFLVLGALAVLLVYMVMAAQYESLIDPLVIMFAVPFAATGMVWALALAGQTVNLVSLIGLVLLIGIVVNNAIVLVDYTNLLRARGLGVIEAARQAGRSRLRPVLMTTLTTVFGLVPLAFARGEGSEIWRPLGVCVLGGLTFSMLVTLVLIPTLYTWAEEIREWHRRRRGALQ